MPRNPHIFLLAEVVLARPSMALFVETLGMVKEFLVFTAGVNVAQHFIRLRYSLEYVFRLFRGIEIRVVFFGPLVKRLLHNAGSGIGALETKNFKTILVAAPHKLVVIVGLLLLLSIDTDRKYDPDQEKR